MSKPRKSAKNTAHKEGETVKKTAYWKGQPAKYKSVHSAQFVIRNQDDQIIPPGDYGTSSCSCHSYAGSNSCSGGGACSCRG